MKTGLNCKLTSSKDKSGKLSEEVKKKIGQSNKGNKLPGLSEKMKGNKRGSKKRTSIQIENISNSKKGFKNPMFGRPAKNKREVLLISESGSIIGKFSSLKKAGKETGADFRNIQAVCKGRRKKTKGLIFKYND